MIAHRANLCVGSHKESSPEIPIPISMCPTVLEDISSPGCERLLVPETARDRAQRQITRGSRQMTSQTRARSVMASVNSLNSNPGFRFRNDALDKVQGKGWNRAQPDLAPKDATDAPTVTGNQQLRFSRS